MKKLFQIIGFISLMCFSFFYTEKTVSVVKEYDTIMITLRNEASKYESEAIDAKIEGNTIIPGLNGKKVNINKSYSKMKRYGSYNESLLVFSDMLPKITLEKNKNKYIISGNKEKKMVSLIFIVEENTKIDNIVNILNEKKVKGNFFVEGLWLEKNSNLINPLIKDNHNIGNLSYNLDYSNSSFVWIDTIIKKIGKQKTSYCYNEKEDKTTLSACSLNKDYTIRPNIITDKNPLKTIKENLTSGSLISIKINNDTEEELKLIINYINSKGYKIVNLEEHLKE